MKHHIKSRVLLVAFLVLAGISAKAQLNPLIAQYFQNPYIANPAMAGIQSGIRVNLGFKSQWNSVPGAPKNTSITADYGGGKVGLGLNLYKDQAGLLDRTKMVATYAYHLPFSDEDKSLSFGLSLGIQNERLNTNAIIGSVNDPLALGFNNRETILDGDFGVAYTSNKLTIEGSLINLKKQLMAEDQNTADYSTFYTAASYRFNFADWQVTPKLAYRGVRNYKDMIDFGAEVKTFSQQLGLSTLYHSNKSYSFGLTYQKNKQWQLLASYTTPATPIQTYSNGSFEVGLQLNLSKMKRDEKVDIKN
jgi:type IX secretion system PorP/SprF family membrane protein